MGSSKTQIMFVWMLICLAAMPMGLKAGNYPWHEKPLVSSDSINARAPFAAAGIVKRLFPKHIDKFSFKVIPPDDGHDVFEIIAHEGKVIISGNTGTSMAMGLNWYLKNYCKCNVSWFGNSLVLPEKLPTVDTRVRKISWARYRYFLNYCCFGYSLAWWDWEQWERLIDWMALNGINAPLAVTGQEATWLAVCKRLQLDDEQISAFLAGPPYLPFGWMGCLDGWGGPLPQSWIERHEKLAKKILTRQRELGMTPIQQGFTGHVPAGLREVYPDAKLHTINWIEWTTYLLDPLDSLFQKIADIFMEEQTSRFGTDHIYAADTYIEMVPPSGDLDYLANMSKAIYNGMGKNDPEAIWVLQTWIFFNQKDFWTQPRIEAFLGAIPDEKMLCLDLFCETEPQWSRTQAFYGKPWLWCNVQNFGCTVHLGGALEKNNSGLFAARQHCGKGKLAGLGFVNEGLGYNPVAYDLMFEMAWRNETVDLSEWIRGYAFYRYGQSNADAEQAWQDLKYTVYTAPHRTRSIIDHLPTLDQTEGPPYSNKQLADAWQNLLKAADKLGDYDTYRFDLVNIARQVLSNHAAVIHQKITEAFKAKDYESFKGASDDFLELMLDMDELLGTRQEFLLGVWLENAKRWGTTPEEKAVFEWNARRLLTMWGQTPMLHDYARKEWSGLISGYYHVRWKWFLYEVANSLKVDEPFDDTSYQSELSAWMVEWSDAGESFPSKPRGDCIAVATKLWDKYHDAFQ
jgi:alpha-N-acetylglucosaminidase